MDEATRRTLIEQYKDGYHAVITALEGIHEIELDRRRSPDEWTVREIAHHLGDSEMISAIRLRRLLVEDHPRIEAYDEREFARRLYYSRQIATSLAAFRAARESNATILEQLTEADWTREGTHSESGPYSVETWLRIYVRHGHDHAAQITRARG